MSAVVGGTDVTAPRTHAPRTFLAEPGSAKLDLRRTAPASCVVEPDGPAPDGPASPAASVVVPFLDFPAPLGGRFESCMVAPGPAAPCNGASTTGVFAVIGCSDWLRQAWDAASRLAALFGAFDKLRCLHDNSALR